MVFSFFLLHSISRYGNVLHFIHWPTEGHIGCFQFSLAIMNYAAVSLYVDIYFNFFWVHTVEGHGWITW